MKHRILVSLFMMLMTVGTVYAQKKDATAEINKIKLSRDYLCATGSSMNSREEASNYGKLLLADEIEKWLKDNAKGDVTGYITKSKENMSVIETKRGSLFRSFIYVKKTDILPYYAGETMMSDIPQTVDISQSQQVKDLPQSEDVKEIGENLAAGNKQNATYTLSEEENKMLDVLDTKTFNDYLNRLKKSGHLNSYGMQKAWPVLGTVYVFFIARDKSVGEHIRMVDGNAVDLSNGISADITDVKEKYKNGGYIWFTLK